MLDLNLYHKNLTTTSIGQNPLYFYKLDSTNTKAFKLAKVDVENGTVVITDNQTMGRGRQSNKWFSLPNKSLTFSVILFPQVSLNKINYFPLIAGLAISDALLDLDIKPQLKWPNDILINDKKAGGILCESKLSGEKINTLVIGIGININENIDDFPDYLKSTSTTLFSESGKVHKLEIVLTNILNKLEHRLNDMDDFANQITDWEKNCAHLNSEIFFKHDNKIINGKFKGLTEKGEAIVLIQSEEKIFSSGELVMP